MNNHPPSEILFNEHLLMNIYKFSGEIGTKLFKLLAMHTCMIDTKTFSLIKKELEKQEVIRETSIQLSRSLTKQSKQAIYMVHRNELGKATALLSAIQKKLPKEVNAFFNPAYEEFAEAILFAHFAKTGKLLPYSALKVGFENYLGGISDLTGELARRSVLMGIAKNVVEVQKIRDLVDGVMGQLMNIDFRNGELRRKFDSIKWNLDKIEKVLYDLRLKDEN